MAKTTAKQQAQQRLDTATRRRDKAKATYDKASETANKAKAEYDAESDRVEFLKKDPALLAIDEGQAAPTEALVNDQTAPTNGDPSSPVVDPTA